MRNFEAEFRKGRKLGVFGILGADSDVTSTSLAQFNDYYSRKYKLNKAGNVCIRLFSDVPSPLCVYTDEICILS